MTVKRKKIHNSGKKQEAQERVLEQDRIRREILRYTQELAEEINLRLLLDREMPQRCLQDTFLPENILFLESITVTEIRFPEPQKESGFLTRTGKKIRRIMDRIRSITR